MLKFFLVFSGGGLGSVLRYGMTQMLVRWSQTFPTATFFTNIIACFAIGIITGYVSKGVLTDEHRAFLAVGICGGFSTFSTFSNETVKLMTNNEWATAFFYVSASVIAGFCATFIAQKI